MRDFEDIDQLFRQSRCEKKYLNVSAPMVRYSKLEFRKLLRQNNVNLCFTPMIIADSFIRSQEARLSEFTTSKDDHPIIAQFAARNSTEMLAASNLVYPYVNGVDLNCGCPQSWAIAKGYGCALLRNPELVRDIVQTLRRNLPSNFSCSLKLRLLQEDIKSTVDLFRQLEKCGATFLVIHGRTQWQKTSHPLDVSGMAEIKKSIQIPLIVNGNVRTLQDANDLYEQTQADGIMAARGLLANPSLFTGFPQTTLDCLQQWLNIAYTATDNLSFQCFHHHLTFMWGKIMRRRSRVQFNNLSEKHQVFEFFDQTYGIRPSQVQNWIPNTVCEYDDYSITDHAKNEINSAVGDESIQKTLKSNTNGQFFNSFKEKCIDVDGDTDLSFQNGSIFDL